jgi:hypothetical protein
MFPENPTLGQVAQIHGVWFEWDGWTWSRRDKAPTPPPDHAGGADGPPIEKNGPDAGFPLGASTMQMQHANDVEALRLALWTVLGTRRLRPAAVARELGVTITTIETFAHGDAQLAPEALRALEGLLRKQRAEWR